MRRPLDGARRITGNAASHAAYNVGPATDYGADMSEVIRAPFGGWVTRWWSTTGGYTVAITNNQAKFTLQHMSAYAGKSAGQVNEGDVIGYVGNTGTATTGPHVHCWIVLIESGQRISFEQYLVNQGWTTAALEQYVPGPDKNSKLAGTGGLELIIEESEGDFMPAVIKRTEDVWEWSLVWPSLAGPTSLERGYITTKDEKVAMWWERFFERGAGTADNFNRADYVAAQTNARLIHAAWLAAQPAVAAVAIDYAKLAALIKVPTAAETATEVQKVLPASGTLTFK